MPKPLADPLSRAVAVLALVLVGGASACASLDGGDAPACQGPRRAANPHGSVLTEAPAPQSPAAAAPGACGSLTR
jgi:hypothetical protein